MNKYRRLYCDTYCCILSYDCIYLIVLTKGWGLVGALTNRQLGAIDSLISNAALISTIRCEKLITYIFSTSKLWIYETERRYDNDYICKMSWWTILYIFKYIIWESCTTYYVEYTKYTMFYKILIDFKRFGAARFRASRTSNHLWM